MRPILRDKKRKRAILSFNVLSAGFFIILALRSGERQLELLECNERTRRWYVRPINISRPIRSEYHLLISDFYEFNEMDGLREYFRMDRRRLFELFERVKPLLAHRKTHRYPISEALRFSMTIKLLASGDSILNTAKSYRIGYATAFKIFYEVCDALWTVLQPEFLALPSPEEWRRIADDYWKIWNFPLCLGAIDGKHIVIKKPVKSGSAFFNYKLDYSIVLMAVADANYCFSYVDIGGYGRTSDGGIFRECAFGKALSNVRSNSMRLPEITNLPGTNIKCPYVFVADAAFPISGRLLRPYGGLHRDPKEQLFDYRLSRARRIIENTFGIMSARWRILCRPLSCSPDNATKIVKACVVLHNYLRKTDEQCSSNDRYMPSNLIDHVDEATGQVRGGTWRADVPVDTAMMDLPSANFRSELGKAIRKRMTDYFVTEEGSVPWQLSKIPALRGVTE